MKILPKPTKIEISDSSFVFSASTRLEGASELVSRELFFLDFEKADENFIRFEKSTDIDCDYTLTISDAVLVKSATDEGLFHGAMTLKQLIFEYYCDGISRIPECIISDSPKYEYRGFMLDISRHFFRADTIKRLIDMLALIKMNKLHLHLSDNQGFRIESERYPELNRVGSVKEGVRCSGYVTKSDIKEIVNYAGERFIEVIPEIDMPGHTLDLIASYPELSCDGKKIEVAKHFTIDNRILCAGKKSTFDFVFGLLDEICECFPSPGYFHIGGDEVPKARWKKCEDCNQVLREQGLTDYEQLQGYFTNRLIKHLEKHDKVAIVWNEALRSGMLDKSAAVQYWNEGKGAKIICKALEEGRKVIVSKVFAYYLDYTYGMCSLKAAYDFDPSAFDVSDDAKKNVIGVEAPLWTEFVPSEKKLFNQTFPRLFAVAEAGWCDGKKDYVEFEDRLDTVLGIMLAYDLNYADPQEWNPSKFTHFKDMVTFPLKFVHPPKQEELENG